MSEESTPALPGFKHVYPINVRWGDMDAMRHVNNTKYFYYGESARLDFLLKLFPDVAAGGSSSLEDAEHGFALAYADTKFKVSLTYPDKVLIGTAVTQLNETEFYLKHSIYSTKLSCEAALSNVRIVYFDFKLGKRKLLGAQELETLEQYRAE